MANGTDLETSIRDALLKVVEAVKDATEVKVVTKYVVVDEGGITEDQLEANAKVIAQTRIPPDGDFDVIVPMRTDTDGNPQLDPARYAMHQNNVRAALEYRAQVLEIIGDTLAMLVGRGQ